MAKQKSAAAPKEALALSPEQTPVTGEAIATAAQERQPGDEATERPKRPYEPVRGWTTRLTGPVKYRKFTDDTLHIIAFKFDLPANEKLPEEVLAVMRDNKQDKDGTPTGLKFLDTRKHGKIWSIPNDLEGRTLADKIDFRLSQLAEKKEETQGKTPF